MSRAARGVGTYTVHRCRTVPATGATPLLHAVVPPTRPGGRAPLADVRDAGHVVLGEVA